MGDEKRFAAIRAWADGGFGVLARADADVAFEESAKRAIRDLLEENQQLREAAVRVVDNHEAIMAARPVDGCPLTIAHWNEIERLKIALGRPPEFDVDAAVAALDQVMLIRLGKANQERDQARADLAAAREALTEPQASHELEARAYQAAVDEGIALLAAARADAEKHYAEAMRANDLYLEACSERDAARAEVERLRGALESITALKPGTPSRTDFIHIARAALAREDGK